MEEMHKSYFAIIPANVRYDPDLTPNAKLLYGEITALCNERGFCWASNSYFAELYGVSKVSISKWIKQLIGKGYLNSQTNYKEGTKEILNRYLTIVNDPIKEKLNTPIKEKFKENNTVSNNTSNNTDYIYSLFEHWNGKGIIEHRKMTNHMKRHANARLEDYSLDELKAAINNYAAVLASDDHYWTHKWTLEKFLKPGNVERFLDEAEPLDNFKKDSSGSQNKLQGYDPEIDKF